MAADATPPKSSFTIGILVAVYIALVVFSFWGSYQFTTWGKPDSLKDFAGLVTIALAASSALMGAVIGFFTLYKNQEAAADLERVKAQLQGDVFWNKIWTDSRFEFEKTRTANANTAYAKLWSAADFAYKSLARLEAGLWKPDYETGLDAQLNEARTQLIFTRNPDHELLWEKIRQKARFLYESARAADAATQKQLWSDNLAEFAVRYDEFKQIAQTEMNRPPQPEAKTN